jgi:two-component system cell cycle response regulator DivK
MKIALSYRGPIPVQRGNVRTRHGRRHLPTILGLGGIHHHRATFTRGRAILHSMVTMPLSDAILVVDDDADSRELLVEYLEDTGFTVYGAPTGETALTLADTLRPRVILMDLSMPNLDGLETTRRLRSNPSTRAATIVMVTARAFIGDRNAAHRAGCDFFIPKPYALPTVATLVAGLMSARPQAAGRLPLNFAPQSR